SQPTSRAPSARCIRPSTCRLRNEDAGRTPLSPSSRKKTSPSGSSSSFLTSWRSLANSFDDFTQQPLNSSDALDRMVGGCDNVRVYLGAQDCYSPRFDALFIERVRHVEHRHVRPIVPNTYDAFHAEPVSKPSRGRALVFLDIWAQFDDFPPFDLLKSF